MKQSWRRNFLVLRNTMHDERDSVLSVLVMFSVGLRCTQTATYGLRRVWLAFFSRKQSSEKVE